eukprot:577072-Amphidinium_carterae.1
MSWMRPERPREGPPSARNVDLPASIANDWRCVILPTETSSQSPCFALRQHQTWSEQQGSLQKREEEHHP